MWCLHTEQRESSQCQLLSCQCRTRGKQCFLMLLLVRKRLNNELWCIIRTGMKPVCTSACWKLGWPAKQATNSLLVFSPAICKKTNTHTSTYAHTSVSNNNRLPDTVIDSSAVFLRHSVCLCPTQLTLISWNRNSLWLRHLCTCYVQYHVSVLVSGLFVIYTQYHTQYYRM